jgi:hypothetical protein
MELMLIVAWPVSPLWIAAARVRHLMELACDEAVLAGADAAERRRYGHLLLDVAEQRSLAFAGAGSLHFGSTLRARIEAIALQCLWPRAVQTATITLAVAGFAACSSAGPTTAQTTGSTQSAATAGADDYGYQYEADPVASASQPASPPTRDANHPGRIPPEIIQSVVRGNFGSFRSCYEKALKTNPKLEGIARIQFTITLNGSVQDAAGDGSTLPDDVVQCVVYGFSHLTFPPPKDGFVTVIYPIEFRPD